MQCPNCGSQIPDSSKKCGVCGVLLQPQQAQATTGFPGWAKGLLIGGGIGLIFFAVLGAAYFFFYFRPSITMIEPTQIPTAVIAPTQPPAPTVAAVVESPPEETPLPTIEPTQAFTPTSTAEPQFCDAFDGVEMTVVYLDWIKNEPLELYVKMSGGVPGLEKEIPDATGEWNYRVKIGDYNSIGCEFIEGYRERLYCEINLPNEYEGAVQPIAVYVDKCEENLHTGQKAFLPEIKKK
ncbi:MAG: zinc ribbon domain-containing protein [Chloroflexi bacterium]|nr:zinc ribbon domain-containing protein [Chloroflexota bacterium]